MDLEWGIKELVKEDLKNNSNKYENIIKEVITEHVERLIEWTAEDDEFGIQEVFEEKVQLILESVITESEEEIKKAVKKKVDNMILNDIEVYIRER